MKAAEVSIPEIADDVLADRMNRIKFVVPAMSGIDGKPYITDEKDEKLFDLFYVESLVDPRTQSFNFDENRKLTGKADGLKEIAITDVIIKVGGYYGFLKMSMAEVLAQIPEAIVQDVVAFALNPNKNADVLPGAEYQQASIIFYGKTDVVADAEPLPSFTGLIKPVDMDRAERLKDKIKPLINFSDGAVFIDPQDITLPFMNIGIWVRINGSNLHRTNTEIKVDVPHKMCGERIAIYQQFGENGADSFNPTYAYTISQIPDELINENTIGFQYHSTDYFKTAEGVIHKTEYTMVELDTTPKFATGRMPNTDFRYEELEGLLACYYLTYQSMKTMPEVNLFNDMVDILTSLAKYHNIQPPAEAAENPRATEEWAKPKKFKSFWSIKDSFRAYVSDFGLVSIEENANDLRKLFTLLTAHDVFERSGFFSE